MLALHQRNNSLATLAVQQRQTSRPLLFDEALHLCGRKNPASEQLDIVRQAENLRQWAFAGIHILSPQLLTMLPDAHAFPLIPAYLDAVAQGARIHGFDAGAYYWRDLGRPDSIAQAELDWDRLKIRETIEPASN